MTVNPAMETKKEKQKEKKAMKEHYKSMAYYMEQREKRKRKERLFKF